MASDLSHDFSAHDIGGEELDSTPPYKCKMPERTRSRLERNLTSQKGNLVTLWSERIRDRNVDWNCVFSASVFLIRTAPPVISR